MERSRGGGPGQTIMPWLGWYSFMRTWSIGDGNNPDSSDIFCVKFVNHEGTAIERYSINRKKNQQINKTKVN